MKFKLLLIIAGVIVVIGALLTIKNRDIDKKPIKIGSISALTGVGVAIGEEEQKGALLAIEEVNQSGGVLGRKLELISEDVSLDKLKNIVAVTKKLVSISRMVETPRLQGGSPFVLT